MAESSSTAAEYYDAASNFSSTYAESEGICYELEACNGDFGLDDKVKDFENTVMLQRQQSGKPPILGIVGLGGVGKTTLAKDHARKEFFDWEEFFDRKSSDLHPSKLIDIVKNNRYVRIPMAESSDAASNFSDEYSDAESEVPNVSPMSTPMRRVISLMSTPMLDGQMVQMVRMLQTLPELPRRRWTNNAFEPLLQHSLNGHVIIPVRGNDIDDDDSGIVATPDSNPVQGNDREYVQNISSLFATCHGAILAVVALIMSAPVSSAVRIFILFISALVSVAIIRDLVLESYKEFSAKRGQQSLRNSLVANQWWVTQRIVLFLIFIMLSLCLLLASNRMLRLHHH